MSRKTKEDYVQVLTSILEALGDHDVEGFVLDFEAAAWMALRHLFPTHSIMGCVFHWTQCLWRKIQDKGLQETYKERSSVHTYLRLLFALPFLPAAHIEPTFRELKGKANTQPLQEVVTYLETTWIRGPIFNPESWSVYGQRIRTNNDVEGWHYRLNHRAGQRATSFYKLVPLLRKEANIVTIYSRLVSEGREGRDRRTVYANMESKIQALWEEYRAESITTGQLLKRTSLIYAP